MQNKCGECKYANETGKILSNALPKDTVRIKDIGACEKVGKRLSELGIYRGQLVKVIRNNRGKMIIGVKGSKLALCKGITERITIY